MATTKTIQPTGETITIPAMTDRPDASVFATDVSRITDAVNSTNQALEIKQHLIPASTTANITSVSALNSALEDSSMNTLAINSGDRPTFVSAGLIPVNLAGTWSVRKLSSGYMFMEYTTYNGRSFYANVNGGTLSGWYENAQKSDIAALPALASFPQKNSLTSRAFSIPNNARLFIYSPAADADLGSYALMCSCSSSGTVKILEIAKGSRMSFATATNTLTINSSSSLQYGPVYMMGNNAESVTEIE